MLWCEFVHNQTSCPLSVLGRSLRSTGSGIVQTKQQTLAALNSQRPGAQKAIVGLNAGLKTSWQVSLVLARCPSYQGMPLLWGCAIGLERTRLMEWNASDLLWRKIWGHLVTFQWKPFCSQCSQFFFKERYVGHASTLLLTEQVPSSAASWLEGRLAPCS